MKSLKGFASRRGVADFDSFDPVIADDAAPQSIIEIEHENFQVLHQRIRLTPLRKFWLAWKMQALGRM